MYLGNIPIGKMFVGDTPVKKAYLGNTKVWPLYDAEVEYLESTGTQWIDTGYVLSASDRIVVQAYFQANDNSGSRILLGVGDPKLWITTGLCRFNDDNSASIANLRQLEAWNSISIDKDYCTCNGTTVPMSVGTFQDNSLSLWLFGANGSTATKTNGRIASCKIYHSGALVRDFIPVRRGNVGYMYDRVSGKLFGNQGTGSFRYGRDIIPVEYLESSGTQWIDTGINANSNLTVQASFTMQNLAASNYGFLFGSRPAKQSKTYAVVFTTKSIGYLVGDGAFSYAGYSSLNVKHTVEIRNDGMLYSDGSLINQVYRGVVTSNTLPLYLFGVNTNGVFDNTQPFIGRVYNTQIYDNNELVRDFIPAKDENGVGFMFDKVSHTIYDNAGSGAFITGPETI